MRQNQTQTMRLQNSQSSKSKLNSSSSKTKKVCKSMSGCRNLRGGKFLNLKRRQPTLKVTMITTFGMISTSLIEMLTRMKREPFLFTNLCLRSILVSLRQIKWRASRQLTSVFISQGDAAVKVQIVDTIIVCHLSLIFWRLRITWEIFLDDHATQLTKKTSRELDRLTKNVTPFVWVRFS